MSLSINNNASALVALETLNQTQESLSAAQNAVATGKKVSSAADNPATYGISSQINNDISGQNAVNDGLSYASEVVGTTLNAADSIVSVLNDVRSSVTDYLNHSGDQNSQDSLNAKLKGLAETINTIADNATVKGVNLFSISGKSDNGISTNKLTFLTGNQGDVKVITGGADLLKLTDSDTAADSPTNLTDALGITNAGAIGTADGDLLDVGTDDANAATVMKTVETALTRMTNLTSNLGSDKITISSMTSYGKNLSDSLTDASSSLVDADMSAESAKLTALQTKQSLGVKALTIANGQSQSILSLFQ